MRSQAIVAIVMAFGVAAMMFGMSGASGVLGAGPTEDMQADKKLNKSKEQHNINDGFEGQAESSGGSGDIIGMIVSGSGALADVLGFIVLLPISLQRIGLPFWFAVPVGVVGQLIVFIGLVQFAANRVWR